MHEEEKTLVFWIGLIILALASVALFGIIWFNLPLYRHYFPPPFEIQFPFIVAAIVFLLLGLYMMKSGVKKAK